jgi:diaminohydroxyphosphoribosylaminopyrimidine deaminase/5-amino-6-(5-phosphoribosylamino)uracil reductase
MSKNSKKKETLSLDEKFMRKALKLALRAKGKTFPNPLVGALVVKDGKILGAGFHRRAGDSHAEVVALNRAKDRARGASLYVTFVTVKVGQSLDGRIATRKGESKWITSLKSREYSKRLRRFYDAIMVGVNTIIKDNPQLDIRTSEYQTIRRPIKIVVDSNLKVPLNARIFSKKSQVIIATIKNQKSKIKNRKLKEKGVRILEIKSKKGKVDLLELMKELAKLEITNILVEGGGKLIGSLFDEGLVDKVIFFVSTSKIIGGQKAISSVEGEGISSIKKTIKLKDVKIKKIDGDLLIEGYVHRYN